MYNIILSRRSMEYYEFYYKNVNSNIIYYILCYQDFILFYITMNDDTYVMYNSVKCKLHKFANYNNVAK